jgi:hypothetical protein
LYATLLSNTSFYELLLAIDRDLAETARNKGCTCGGRLHQSTYWRKPRGRPAGVRLERDHDLRFSFCCDRHGCRGRETPASLRFLGRRVYLAAIVVLIAIARDGITDARLQRLSEIIPVDRRTVERWRRWWRDGFTATPFWQAARAFFSKQVKHKRLPRSLLVRFGRNAANRLLKLLSFIKPVTAGSRSAHAL